MHTKTSKRKHKCTTGKVRFRDHLEAVQVLHSAANARKNAAELGAATNRREVRSYKCPRCHGFHITSQSALAA
ncbi:MAG TPA: hypothetical protein PKA04_00190 [Marmoricola sp.]|nr:hypothetical protein [Marmoricola sp.]